MAFTIPQGSHNKTVFTIMNSSLHVQRMTKFNERQTSIEH